MKILGHLKTGALLPQEAEMQNETAVCHYMHRRHLRRIILESSVVLAIVGGVSEDPR